jgi:hypothetical protein
LDLEQINILKFRLLNLQKTLKYTFAIVNNIETLLYYQEEVPEEYISNLKYNSDNLIKQYDMVKEAVNIQELHDMQNELIRKQLREEYGFNSKPDSTEGIVLNDDPTD